MDSEAVAATGTAPMDSEEAAPSHATAKSSPSLTAGRAGSEGAHEQPLTIETSADEADAQRADANHSLEDSLSPNSAPRRSTRVSALKAQKKLTPSKDMVDTQVEAPPPQAQAQQLPDDDAEVPSAAAADGDDAAPNHATAADLKKSLKRKRTVDVEQLDQYDCKFGIQLDAHGEVVPLTDDSEVSSLDDEDVLELRRRYDASKKQEVSEEVRLQREAQVKELEAALRLEEAKLSMLKKLRDNQQQALKGSEHAKRISAAASSISQNASGNAYKPTLAVPSSQKLNGTAAKPLAGKGARPAAAAANNNSNSALSSGLLTPQHQQLLQTLLQRAGNNPQQFAQLLKQLTPEHIQALLQQQQKMQQSQQSSAAIANAAAAAKSSAAVVAAKAREVAATNAQRISTARIKLRHSLEQQLLAIQPPKAPVPDLSFIPNANQPDFCALLGLDLVVQRVLKDKAVFKRMDFPPYECEECGTDFTPTWKAICGEKEEYHLYCELCVRLAQKRKIRQDHTVAVKRAFHRIQEQEREFERHVAAGKFSDPLPTAPAAALAPPPPQPVVKANNVAAPAKPQHQLGNANTSGGGTGGGQKAQKKRTSTGSATAATSSSNSANAAALAALASNPAALQQRLAAMTAFSQMNTNPMMAAAMLAQNPMLMQQLWSQMITPRPPQQQQQTNNSTTNNSAAMAALLQAAQQSAQHSGARATNGNNSGSDASSGGLNSLFAAQLAQMNAAGGIMNNPQLLRQFQQAQLLQQMRELGAKSGGGGNKK